jgi:hypothetical protein
MQKFILDLQLAKVENDKFSLVFAFNNETPNTFMFNNRISNFSFSPNCAEVQTFVWDKMQIFQQAG